MVSFIAKFNENNIYFSHNVLQNSNVITCEFLFAIQLSSEFSQGSNIYKL